MTATITQVAEAFAVREIAVTASSEPRDLTPLSTAPTNLPPAATTAAHLVAALPGHGVATTLVPVPNRALLGAGGTPDDDLPDNAAPGAPNNAARGTGGTPDNAAPRTPGPSNKALRSAGGGAAGGPSATRATGAGANQGVGPQQLVPGQVADPTQLASLTGLDLLLQLSLLPDAQIADFIAHNPTAVATLLGAQPSAREVQLWWDDLSMDSRSAMLTSAPQLVGNLEGVPFSLRDLANRRFLSGSAHTLETEPGAATGRSEEVEAERERHMFDQITRALATVPGAEPRALIGFDPVGAGTASIVIGDIATADFVTFLVPGMFYTADSQMVEWTASAQSLHDAQTEWIGTLADRDPRFVDATVATVSWIGYETPSLVNFTSLELAYGGRDAIAAAVGGLHEIRGDAQPFVSVIAHSYGSTASMMALRDYGMQLDALGIVGSPGSDAKRAAELGVAGDNVFVGEAPWDQVKDSAFFGADPGSTSFGAHQLSVDGGVDSLTGATLLGSTGHDEYFVRGSESLRNLALVALGQGALVSSDNAGVFFKSASIGQR